MDRLRKNLGYAFQNPDHLLQALTHTSMAKKSYERMEFLGDRILSFVVADMLYAAFPSEEEGALAKRHSALVNQSALVVIAEQINLRDYVQVSGSDKNVTDSVLADVVEALIAALYLDGGFDVAAQFIRRFWAPVLHVAAPPEDSKSRLQEWAQARGLALPVYTVIERTGPDHQPHFTVEVILDGFMPQRGQGPSKQIAEKQAAIALYHAINAESA